MFKNYKIPIISFILLIMAIIIYLSYFQDISNLLQLGLENIIFYLISFLLIVFGISPFFGKYKQEQKKKEAFEIVEYEYNYILNNIGYDLYAFLTKQPYMTDGSNFNDDSEQTTNSLLISDLKKVRDEVEQHFTEDFFERNPLQPVPDETQEFTFIFKEIDIEIFMDEFNVVHRNNIRDFVNNFKSELPEQLKKKLYKLEKSLGATALFTHFQSLNIKNSMTKLDADYEVMKEDYQDILNQVIDLLDYFSDYEILADKSKSFTRYKVKENHIDQE